MFEVAPFTVYQEEHKDVVPSTLGSATHLLPVSKLSWNKLVLPISLRAKPSDRITSQSFGLKADTE